MGTAGSIKSRLLLLVIVVEATHSSPSFAAPGQARDDDDDDDDDDDGGGRVGDRRCWASCNAVPSRPMIGSGRSSMVWIEERTDESNFPLCKDVCIWLFES